ncbi:MAG: hypothetical protein LBL75_00140 [Rickettsiales bacterium]|jgi:hypothetical protein|nr:hypothetical protein [Rickettsiales bacterium]
MKKLLAVLFISGMLSACATTRDETRTHHCQQLDENTAQCVNWVDGEYKMHIVPCNELVCSGWKMPDAEYKKMMLDAEIAAWREFAPILAQLEAEKMSDSKADVVNESAEFWQGYNWFGLK